MVARSSGGGTVVTNNTAVNAVHTPSATVLAAVVSNVLTNAVHTPTATTLISTAVSIVAGTERLQTRWTFDTADVSGTTINDVPNRAHDGTTHGSPTYNLFVMGDQAIVLDGLTQWVQVPKSGAFGQSSLTVSFWANLTTLAPAHDGVMVSTGDGQLGTGILGWYVGNILGTWRAEALTNGPLGVVTTNTLWLGAPDGTTHHYVFTYDENAASNWALYIDGVAKSIQSTSNVGAGQKAVAGNVNDLVIGGQSKAVLGTPAFLMAGTFDDVKYIGGPVSAAEAKALYLQSYAGRIAVSASIVANAVALKPGNALVSGNVNITALPNLLVSEWTFDASKISGTTALDSVGAHNGTINGTITTGTPVQGDQSLVFNGTTNYVTAPNSGALSHTSFGVGFWIKDGTTPGGDAHQGIIGQWDSVGTKGWKIYYESFFGTTYITAGVGQAAATVIARWTFSYGATDRIFISYDESASTNWSLYKNGTFQAVASSFNTGAGQPALLGNRDFYIGVEDSGVGLGNFLKATLDKVRYYAGAQSAAQAKADYLEVDPIIPVTVSISAATGVLINSPAFLAIITNVVAATQQLMATSALASVITDIAASTFQSIGVTAIAPVQTSVVANAQHTPAAQAIIPIQINIADNAVHTPAATALVSTVVNIIATGTQDQKALATVPVQINISALAAEVFQGTALIAVTTTIAANASHTPTAQVTAAVNTSIAVNAVHTATGTALIAVQTNVVAVGTEAEPASEAVTVQVSIIAFAETVKAGTALIQGQINIAANAQHTPTATAVTAVNANVIVDGAALAVAQTTIACEISVTAATTRLLAGRTTIAVQADISADATVIAAAGASVDGEALIDTIINVIAGSQILVAARAHAAVQTSISVNAVPYQFDQAESILVDVNIVASSNIIAAARTDINVQTNVVAIGTVLAAAQAHINVEVSVLNSRTWTIPIVEVPEFTLYNSRTRSRTIQNQDIRNLVMTNSLLRSRDMTNERERVKEIENQLLRNRSIP